MGSERSVPDDAVVEDLVREAYRGATSGAVAELDLSLARLRAVAPDRAEALSEELHAVARCVRAHPAFGGAAEAPPAPGEGRAAG